MGNMILSCSICIDPNRAFVGDADDDHAPLVEITFHNELRDFSEEEKLKIVKGIANSIVEIRPANENEEKDPEPEKKGRRPKGIPLPPQEHYSWGGRGKWQSTENIISTKNIS